MDKKITLGKPLLQLLSNENLALLKQGDRFVILAAGLVVMAALGAVVALRDSPVATAILVILAMLIVLALVALVQFRASSLQNVETALHRQSAAAMAVNGNWWQLVYAKDHPGLSYLCISISEIAERHAIDGITYDFTGRRLARWSSDTVAVKTSTPLELYYIWRGTILVAQDTKVISGIGRFRFDSVGHENDPQQGEGAFTRGSTTELNFGSPRSVEIIRFTAEESRRLEDDPSVLDELAKAAFERFQLEKGRMFGELSLTADEEQPPH